MASYEILGMDYQNDSKKFERDLAIMNELEFEVAQALEWNFHQQTYYDLVVGYLSKGVLSLDDEISTNWLEFYEENVKCESFTETMEAALGLSFVNVLPGITGPPASYVKLKDLEPHQLNDLCIVFEAFCLELCYKLQFQFNFLGYYKNEFAVSIAMLMKSYLFNPAKGSGTHRIFELCGFKWTLGEDSCMDTIKSYLDILYTSLGENSSIPVERSPEEKTHSKKRTAKSPKKKSSAKRETFSERSSPYQQDPYQQDPIKNGQDPKQVLEKYSNPSKIPESESHSSPTNKSDSQEKGFGQGHTPNRSQGSTQDSGPRNTDSENSGTKVKKMAGYPSNDPILQTSDIQLQSSLTSSKKNLLAPKSSGFNSIKKILGERRIRAECSGLDARADSA